MVLDVLANVYLFLRLVDGSSPAMGKVYVRCIKIHIHFQDHIKDAHSTEFSWLKHMHSFFNKRWGDMHTPLHFADYMLDSQHWG